MARRNNPDTKTLLLIGGGALLVYLLFRNKSEASSGGGDGSGGGSGLDSTIVGNIAPSQQFVDVKWAMPTGVKTSSITDSPSYGQKPASPSLSSGSPAGNVNVGYGGKLGFM